MIRLAKSSSPKYLVFILFLVSVTNFLDRQVLAIVQEDIKAEFSLTDSNLGLLALAFGVIHGSFALPVGRLADRFSRKRVLIGCLTVWSGITLLTALVMNFVQLVITRIGVALGEAGVTPTSYSMIADRFETVRRAGAIAIVGAGAPIGLMLALFFGGAIADQLGWRITYVVFGVPGLVLAVVIWLTVAPPKVGAADGVAAPKRESFLAAISNLIGNKAYLLILVAATLQSIVSYGVLQWSPSFLIRKFELDATSVGMTLGPLFGVFGLSGMLCAAFAADHVAKRDFRWYAWIPAGCVFICWPFFAAAILSSHYGTTLAFLAIFLVFANAPIGITNALIQNVAPVQRRGVAAGMKTVSLSFLGYGVGGALIGFLSDIFAQGDKSGALGVALLAVSCFLPVAALTFFICSVGLNKAITVARAASEA